MPKPNPLRHFQGAVQLASALEKSTRLRLLDLWNAGIGAKGAAALASALTRNTGLERLFLNENAIGAGAAWNESS